MDRFAESLIAPAERKQLNILDVIPLLIAIGLLATSFTSFLLYHTLVEFFSITTALCTAIIAWQTHSLTKNYFITYVGAGYLFIALFDLCHLLTFPGLISDDPAMSNLTTQFWVAGRFLESMVLVTSPFFLNRRCELSWVGAGLTLYSVALFGAIMSGYFPTTLDLETGLTKFKIYAEISCVVMLVGAWYLIYSKRALIHEKIVRPILGSIVLTILAELFFTQYSTVFDFDVTIGHAFRLASYWLVFTVFNRFILAEPILVLARGSYTFDIFRDPVLLTDVNGFIRQSNVACRRKGQLATEIIGADVHHQLHPKALDRAECPVCSALRGIDKDTVVQMDLSSELVWEVSLSPIKLGPYTYGVVHVMRDISERRRIMEQREQVFAAEHEARVELEKANRMKDEFLATVSHELRNPLAVIEGGVHLLKREDQLSEGAKSIIAKIERNTSLLTHIVNDLLDVSRILQGKLFLKLEPVNLGRVAATVVAFAEGTAQVKSIEVTSELAQDCWIKGDVTRLNQVIWNLLTNAYKFTPEGGKVRVTVAKTARAVELRVIDTGRGIEAEFLPYVFDRFRQQDNSITRAFGGLGLGLSIVKVCTEAMGGNVAVESAGPGQGATFILRFPAQESP